VAYVQRVDGPNVYIEDYNHRFDGRYDARWVPASSFTGYIHFKDRPAATTTPPAVQNNPAPIQGGNVNPQPQTVNPQGPTVNPQGPAVNPQEPKPGQGGGGQPTPPPSYTLTVDNRVTNGGSAMREDTPSYLSTVTRNFCKRDGCAIGGTDRSSGQT